MLAVLGTMLALAIPAMRRSLAKNELCDTAGQLRTVLAKARLAAIESGAIQVFCYEPNTGRFLVMSHAAPTGTPDAEPPAAEEPLDEAATQLLAHDIVFLDPNDEESVLVDTDEETQSTEDSRFRVIDAKPVDDSPQWSKPVVFYPSGRASSARFRLIGQFDYYIDVELRGLTGRIKLGDVQRPKTRDEFEREKDSSDERETKRETLSPEAEVPRTAPESPPEAPYVPPAPPPAPPDEPAAEAQP